MQIVVKKGLDIPLKGGPVGAPFSLPPPKQCALNLEPFEELRFKVLVKQGDVVKIGTPLVENKEVLGQYFVSPAGGVVKEIRRGLKRRIHDIIIDVSPQEENETLPPFSLETGTRESLLSHLLKGGIFPHIRQRPFDVLATPHVMPRSIFVRAVESLPFVPSAELQVEGHEEMFAVGLKALTKLTKGKVHLVYAAQTPCKAFTEASGIEKHTVKGCHPKGTSSLHIQKIDPIAHGKDYVWTLGTSDVIAVGKMVAQGRYHTQRVIGIGGGGILPGKNQFVKGRLGLAMATLCDSRLVEAPLYLISGDPLTGKRVTDSDFLHFYDTCVTALKSDFSREMFHFLGMGGKKYSATKAYLSGHIPPPPGGYDLTTKQHGEERPFVDAAIYDKVMPLRIPTMFLVRALLSENFELAETLGLFEVASEDFALPAFICPSKIEMIEIVKEGLLRYAKEH